MGDAAAEPLIRVDVLAYRGGDHANAAGPARLGRHRTLDFVLSNTCNRTKTLLVSFVEIAFVSIVSRRLRRLTA